MQILGAIDRIHDYQRRIASHRRVELVRTSRETCHALSFRLLSHNGRFRQSRPQRRYAAALNFMIRGGDETAVALA